MNKKVLLGCATALAITSAVIAANPASAAEVDTTSTARNLTTEGSINFYTDNKPDDGPFAKNLSLAYVPAEFNFGGNKSTGVTGVKTYSQVRAANAGKQWVAVSDDRDAEAKAAWKLNAKLDPFVSGSGTQATYLENADLTFTLGAAQKYQIDVAASDAAKMATPNPNGKAADGTDAVVDFAAGDGSKYTLGNAGSITLSAGTVNQVGAAQEILGFSGNDAKAAGVASEVSNVKLTVKDHSSVADKKFSSTVHWNLSDTATD